MYEERTGFLGGISGGAHETESLELLVWQRFTERHTSGEVRGRMTAKKKILIADDNESIHDILGRALSRSPFEIIHAYDGERALKIAEDERPDLVILDILMPLMDGRDVCKKLKEGSETKDTKIIMLTARAEQHDRRLGLELGADDYVPKPFSVNCFCRKVSRLCEAP